MSKITSLIRRAPKRVAAVVAMVAAAIIVPAALLAYGPERPTYTYERPADHVTFNSITNNPNVGDERNFVRIREDVAGTTYTDNVNLAPGKTYSVMVYYHNNAASNLNASGRGVAKDTSLRIQMPGVLEGGATGTVNGYISASNATPGTVWDEAYAKNATNADIALRYVANSAKVTSNGAVNGATLPETLFTTGTKLGYDALNGTLPGCNQYAGYVTFKFTVDQPNFEVNKEVSVDAGKTYSKTAVATPGSTVQYRVMYQNTGTTQQDGVVVSDKLPNKVSYINDTTYIAKGSTGGKYELTSNGITTNGLNIGSFAPKANAYLKFSAKIADEKDLVCGTNTLVNTARVNTSGGWKESTATVTVNKTCEPTKIQVCELATKKIISIDEDSFDASKHSKDLSKCEEVKIEVCEIATKNIITINEGDFDADKHTKNLNDCKELPTPPELPHTGATETILGVLGIGSIVASLGYYLASRKALGKNL